MEASSFDQPTTQYYDLSDTLNQTQSLKALPLQQIKEEAGLFTGKQRKVKRSEYFAKNNRQG